MRILFTTFFAVCLMFYSISTFALECDGCSYAPQEIFTLKKYDNSLSLQKVRKLKKLPFLDKGYVPAGFFKTKDYDYYSYFHRPIFGEKPKTSMIVEYKKGDSVPWKIYEIYEKVGKNFNVTHNGLVVTPKFFILTEGVHHVFFNRDITLKTKSDKAGTRYYQVYLDKKKKYYKKELEQEFEVFTSYSRDANKKNILWLGQYIKGPEENYPKLSEKGLEIKGFNTDRSLYLYGYELLEHGISPKPLYTIAVPNDFQFVRNAYILQMGKKRFDIFLGQSFKENSSLIWRLTFVTKDGSNYRIPGNSAPRLIFMGPSHLEMLDMNDKGELIGISSSGGVFRHTANLGGDYFPFEFIINSDQLNQ